MNRRQQEQRIQWTWAGIILALFVARQVWRHSQTPIEPAWVAWETIDTRSKSRSVQPNRRQQQKVIGRTIPAERKYPVDQVVYAVRSDTVSSAWLLNHSRWPAWKVDQFIRARDRWGGMDSSVMDLDWVATHIQWQHEPIPMQNLNTMSREALGSHPLIGWDRAKVLHQYRSRVRPFQSWDEVWALGIGDSTSKAEWPSHFILIND